MKVLVTGGSGFLGSHIAEQLSREGHSVRALVRKSSNRKFLETLKGLEFAYGAVEDAANVAEAVKGVDAIIHAAGIVKARSPEEFRATNTQGTINLLEAAKKHAPGLKRFVQVSSLEASGPSTDGKPVPVSQENPVTSYGRSKLEAEKAVLAARNDLPVTILRPTAIYGPRDMEILEVFRSIKKGVLPITGDGRTLYTFTYASDCARACIAAVTADVPSGSTYFVDDGQIYVWRDALEEVEKAVGKRAFVRIGLPLGVMRMVAVGVETYGKLANSAVMLTREKVDMLMYPAWVCNSADTQRELGWKPEVSWREGTARAARWYEENGLI
jgi:nucleoside-diphosphate-sugar epimerase